ncbi:NERD domain-containing protein [Bacillus sp. AGMB 02131]|uniref:NERD domain-containing protein n=1 Tax=Peribacillus faecalis TaxID=2772559 RepID=A0A927D061_9BACI|nr:nuclease-related domain-containing protein [Peribacillus faecalis]MBD3110231.1 NERD domain-containing protein [Peribacillus faecalis]
MIKKERLYPLSALQLDALLRRLPANHEKRQIIEKDLAKVLAGYRGEQTLDYHLNFLDDVNHLIFHDVRLPLKNHFFQIDTLILTSRFAFILEAKNLFGSITFDPDFNQLIRMYLDTEEVFPDPVTQVNNQKFKLAQWLKNHGYTIPIYTKVVISNPHTIMKSNTNNQRYLQQIIRSANIVSAIMKTSEQQSPPILTDKDLKKLTRLILKDHTEFYRNNLKRYALTEAELTTGLHCPSCSHIPLIKKRYKWHCSNCSYADKHAVIHSLFDYYLLLGPTITNKQFRRFFDIPSTSTSTKTLTSLNLSKTGTTKGVVYQLCREYFDSKI